MNKEIIKEILSKDLKKISTDGFNETIIQQLNLSNKKEKLTLFDEKFIVGLYVITSFFILIITSNIVEKLNPNTVIVGLFICITPLIFITFNKIYQSVIQNYENHI